MSCTVGLAVTSLPASVALNTATVMAYGLKEASTSKRTFQLERLGSASDDRTVIAVAGFCTKKAGHVEATWKNLHLAGVSKVLLHWEAKRFNDLYGIIAPTGAGAVVALWHEAKRNAKKAGYQLADELRSRNVIKGPVSLIGHSLGARVIIYALKDLAKSGHTNLVHNVILLGAAIPACPDKFSEAQRAVMGHLINVFSPKDKVLKIGYRSLCAQWDVAGMQPVVVPGVINIDATPLLSGESGGHSYADDLDKVMHCIKAVLVEMGSTDWSDNDDENANRHRTTCSTSKPTEMTEFQPKIPRDGFKFTMKNDPITKAW
eukprot:CAMPEP_0114255246 /NCGR_PEP_ID=MMETSP0058-20121206/17445_1 /TAXON_ID=36894 /ORGANISM="Pyramimonas parkeae, CCMP726" /LENGTH=317 /DNA_ID=CAMNT_0001369589 /DNA_START=102 /DNA_END=1052 /DNA_ORIENTATION=+